MLTKLTFCMSVLFVVTILFSKLNFRFQPCLSNGGHDITQISLDFNGAVIIIVEGSNYRIHFHDMSKIEVVSKVKNATLSVNS